MFSQPTVFVIGAGASAEFGMPSGPQLMRRVGAALDFRRREDGSLLGDPNLYALLADRFRTDIDRHYDAACELSRIIREFHFDSIDEVLHWFSADPQVVDMGKATIVQEILAAERSSTLFNPDDPEKIPSGEYPTAWTPHFLSMAVGSLKKEEIARAFSNVTIINFNYDRTIEHFIYSELQTKLGINQGDAKDAVSKLKMIRPYGTVGHLPWEGQPSTIPFGADLRKDHEKLFTLSKNLYTYTEQNVSQGTKNDVEAAIINARLIVFLGFGFHQQNMNILKVATHVGRKQVLATVLGIDQENYDDLKPYIFNTLICTSEPHLLPQVAYVLMLHMRPTILNPHR